MMKRMILGMTAGLLLVAWQSGPGFAAAAKSSCLGCHTNDRVMKALYKPPVLEGGEGEG